MIMLSVTQQLDYYVHFWPSSYPKENFGYSAEKDSDRRLIYPNCKHSRTFMFWFSIKNYYLAFHSADIPLILIEARIFDGIMYFDKRYCIDQKLQMMEKSIIS